MRKSIVLATLVIALGAGLAAAQDVETQETNQTQDRIANAGMITPDSAFYGLETAWDNAGMAVGLKKPGDVAKERAAEAEKMAEEGNYEAAQRAARNMNRAAERGGQDDVEGIKQAESVLQRVMENAPEEAKQGLQKAMKNVRENGPEALGAPEDVGPDSQPGEPEGSPNTASGDIDQTPDTNESQPEETGTETNETPTR